MAQAPCKFGWGCTREGCWFIHPNGREHDGDPHPISAAGELDPEKIAARAARFQTTVSGEKAATYSTTFMLE
jgi:hypothetical protein